MKLPINRSTLRIAAFSPAEPAAAPAAPAAPAAAPAAPAAAPDPAAAPVAAPVVPPVAAPVVPAAAPAAPAPLTLTLPDQSGLEPAVVERTTAIASELGLSQDHAQKVLGLVAQEASTHATAAIAKAQEALLPGGAVWEKNNADWKAAALADTDLGNGKPEQLAAQVDLGKRVLATFFPKEAIAFLDSTGLASHPDTLKGLVRIGKAMREDQLVTPNAQVPGEKLSAAQVLYGDAK